MEFADSFFQNVLSPPLPNHLVDSGTVKNYFSSFSLIKFAPLHREKVVKCIYPLNQTTNGIHFRKRDRHIHSYHRVAMVVKIHKRIETNW